MSTVSSRVTVIRRRLTIEVGSVVEWVSSWDVGSIAQASDCQAKEDDRNEPLDIPAV